MASYDGTNKSSAGCAQHLPYWEINTPYTRELYNEAMAEASPEAVKFCNPDGYNGPEIEVDTGAITNAICRVLQHGDGWDMMSFLYTAIPTEYDPYLEVILCSKADLFHWL